MNLNLNVDISDDARREALYAGQLFLYGARKTTRALCAIAQQMAEEAFAPHDPRKAQFSMPVEEYVEILAQLKPKFIHDPRCKAVIRDMLADFGCDIEKTYFDVPRLRTVTAKGYLTSGLGYAFKPHRDTWYSPPMCQLNWWLPVYPVEANNTMALHPHYWDRPIANTSSEFDYQNWQQTGRKSAAKQVGKDTRRQSEAIEPLDLEPDLRCAMETGGLMVFSAAHLHSTAPNLSDETRLSIDFRTVHLDDLVANRGAPNCDSACTGTTIRDYLRGSDFCGLPDDLCRVYETKPITRDALIGFYPTDSIAIPTSLNQTSTV